MQVTQYQIFSTPGFGAIGFRPALVEFVISLLEFCAGTEALRRKVHNQNLLAKKPVLGDLYLSCSLVEQLVWHNLYEFQ